jgi:hypothetical protein
MVNVSPWIIGLCIVAVIILIVFMKPSSKNNTKTICTEDKELKNDIDNLIEKINEP